MCVSNQTYAKFCQQKKNADSFDQIILFFYILVLGTKVSTKLVVRKGQIIYPDVSEYNLLVYLCKFKLANYLRIKSTDCL